MTTGQLELVGSGDCFVTLTPWAVAELLCGRSIAVRLTTTRALVPIFSTKILSLA